MKTPDELSTECVFSEFLRVKKQRLKFQNGYEHDHFTLSLPTPLSVSIIAQETKGRFIINEEYRHATGETVLSLPGGFLGDETPIEGAKRELLEETGYSSHAHIMIGSSYPMPGICDQKVVYVYASDCRHTQSPDLEGGELIKTTLMSKERLKAAILSGAAVDGILLAGLALCDFVLNH